MGLIMEKVFVICGLSCYEALLCGHPRRNMTGILFFITVALFGSGGYSILAFMTTAKLRAPVTASVLLRRGGIHSRRGGEILSFHRTSR
jgi:hypothetical protein